MKRIALVLILLSPLFACGEASENRTNAILPESRDSIPDHDRYIQALRALVNAQGCASTNVRGARWRPTQAERDALNRRIEEIEQGLKAAEIEATSKGFGDYLEQARKSLSVRLAEELHAACAPNEAEALRNAKNAIAAFHDQVTESRPASGSADRLG